MTQTILVTGATGFIGGHLIPVLLERGHTVRALTRDRTKLDDRPWRGRVEVVQGDVGDWVSLDAAMAGVDRAVYLVHGMDDTPSQLVRRETEMARTFRDAADRARLSQVVYLGGLVDPDTLTHMSTHMYARYQAGVELRQADIPVVELRAAIVLGEGSASYQMLRAGAKLPFVPVPRWARSRCQPIWIGDIVRYLAATLERDDLGTDVIEVGGPEALSYAEMGRRYLRISGSGWRPSVPMLYSPPEASAPVISMLSGVDQDLVLPLMSSARHDAVVREDRAGELFPDIEPLGFDEAIRRVRSEDAEVAR